MSGESIEQYIRRKFEERLIERLAAEPWWCFICGEGGNYEGERPAEYWFPPADHVCNPKAPELHGIQPS